MIAHLKKKQQRMFVLIKNIFIREDIYQNITFWCSGQDLVSSLPVFVIFFFFNQVQPHNRCEDNESGWNDALKLSSFF